MGQPTQRLESVVTAEAHGGRTLTFDRTPAAQNRRTAVLFIIFRSRKNSDVQQIYRSTAVSYSSILTFSSLLFAVSHRAKIKPAQPRPPIAADPKVRPVVRPRSTRTTAHSKWQRGDTAVVVGVAPRKVLFVLAAPESSPLLSQRISEFPLLSLVSSLTNTHVELSRIARNT